MGGRVFGDVSAFGVASITADPGVPPAPESNALDPVGVLVLLVLLVLGLEIRFRRATREVLGSPVPLRRAEMDSAQVVQSFRSDG